MTGPSAGIGRFDTRLRLWLGLVLLLLMAAGVPFAAPS